MIGLDISQFEEFADLSTHIESDDEEEDDSLLARMLQEVAVPSKQAFLCVLDVRDGELMLRKVGGETVVKRMLQYITDLAKQRVIACPTDKFGVVLFGVPSQGEGVFRYLNPLVPLDFLDVSVLKKLESFAESFEPVAGKSDEGLSEALFFAKQMFTNSAPPKNYRGKLVFYTFSDEGHVPDSKRKKAVVNCQDLLDFGVQIEVVPYCLEPEPTAFNREAFWAGALELDDRCNVLETPVVPNFRTSLITVDDSVGMKEFAVRTLEKATLILPGGAGQCKMAVYTAVLSAPKPRKVFLRRKDNHILKASTFYVTESGERLTEPPKKHFSFARVNIPMNDGQRAAFLASNDSVDNCWTLLGFKPRSCLNREALCCGFTKFAVPLEEPEAVTSDFFSSLHAAMLRKVVFAVARKKTLRGMPRHFALIPVEETRDARGNLLVSAGFSVLPLPWREEVRDIVIKDVGCSDPETVDLFCSLLRSMDLADFELTTESTFKSLANPVIDSIVQAIESVALETDDKPFVDPTSVETDDTETAHIASRLSELLRPAVKRPRPKRVATGKPAAGDPTDETFVRSLAAAGQLQKLTVVNLKAFLDSKNLKTNGKKQDLINRILEYYEESPAKKQAKGEAKLKVSDDDW